MSQSRLKSQQEEAKQIRDSDQMLFGASDKSLEESSAQKRQAFINEFAGHSMMQASVVDMQRDKSY